MEWEVCDTPGTRCQPYLMKRSLLTAPVVLFLPALILTSASVSQGYSVLSHEAIVDAAWEDGIRAILLKRYPIASSAQLREAHAYAYGGCIIQDMGYYPFGNRFFSNLTHYVRSGDFIMALFQESQNMYDYAFALGALAHYAADNVGHPLAVNRSVPIIYPKLHMRYGDVATFEDDPKAHILVEFSFDVVQLAGAGYMPETYSNFVGFRASKPLLDRAFQRTYGLDLRDLFASEDLAIGTYRRGASEIIPQMTRIAWKKKKKEIQKLRPDVNRKEFVYKLSRRDYDLKWGTEYQNPNLFHRNWGEKDAKPGPLARILVFLFRIFPKVGPLQTLSFKLPTPETERMFVQSFKSTLKQYEDELAKLQNGHTDFVNADCDTGKPTHAGDYRLADETYANLLDRLAKTNFAKVSPELRENILAYYGNPSAPIATKQDKERWDRVLRELDRLRSTPTLARQPAQK
jgi:hypothetical protein